MYPIKHPPKTARIKCVSALSFFSGQSKLRSSRAAITFTKTDLLFKPAHIKLALYLSALYLVKNMGAEIHMVEIYIFGLILR